jgi:amino acid transporter
MSEARRGELGTFLGVFTPTILTILGVTMYLRFGWVLGQAGLTGTLAIVVMANAVTLVTTLSFSAIATNSRVGVGGAYYMLSRSLGLEVGGAIGLPLFLSQAFSVTLYAFGLAESVRFVWPEVPVQPAAFVIVLGVGLLTLRGAGLALKIQLPLMVLIGVSLTALLTGAFTGARVEALESTVAPADAVTPTFWAIFAVFFPAVTGVMAGLGLSGDLRDPIRAIPRGAIAAALVGFAIYLGIPFLLQYAASPDALIQDPLIWTRIAPLGALLVLPGLWGAVFSSAVGSMLGAPRTLQAMAKDGLAPALLAKSPGSGGQVPAAGFFVSLLISLGAVLLGNLNAVAPVVTMFFLTVYGMVNLAAALETLSGDTSWRPRINVPWLLALAGGAGCFVVMFLIHPLAAVAAIAIEVGLWLFLARRERQANWGDVRHGVYESLIRWSLIRLSRRSSRARNWRPHVIVFTDIVAQRLDLVRFATWFSQERGVVTVCQLVVGDLLACDIDVEEEEDRIQTLLDKEGLAAFGEVDIVPDVIEGMTDVAQANGIAGLASNTILLGMPRERDRFVQFLKVVSRLERLRKSVVLGRVHPQPPPGFVRNRARNPEWRRARIRLLSLASSELMKERTENYLAKFLPEIRMSAEADVMLLPEGRTVREIIHEKSANADAVFLGLGLPKSPEGLPDTAQQLLDLAAPLKTVFFVKNSSLYVGKLVQTTEEVEEKPVAVSH